METRRSGLLPSKRPRPPPQPPSPRGRHERLQLRRPLRLRSRHQPETCRLLSIKRPPNGLSVHASPLHARPVPLRPPRRPGQTAEPMDERTVAFRQLKRPKTATPSTRFPTAMPKPPTSARRSCPPSTFRGKNPTLPPPHPTLRSTLRFKTMPPTRRFPPPDQGRPPRRPRRRPRPCSGTSLAQVSSSRMRATPMVPTSRLISPQGAWYHRSGRLRDGGLGMIS